MFDELASGRRVKTLTVVDDCSKEAVQIAADTSIPALYVTRLLDQVKAERGLPKVIRTDNGPDLHKKLMCISRDLIGHMARLVGCESVLGDELLLG